VGERGFTEHREVVAGQPCGLARIRWRKKRGVLAEDDRLIEQRGSRVVVLDQAGRGNQPGIFGKGIDHGFGPAGSSQARIFEKRDDSSSGSLQADPAEPGDAGSRFLDDEDLNPFRSLAFERFPRSGDRPVGVGRGDDDAQFESTGFAHCRIGNEPSRFAV
jgi:hypothetical protein